jgi:hypothetical protein
MHVQLGNEAAQHAVGRDDNDQPIHEDLDGKRITTVQIPDDYTLAEAFQCITAPDGVAHHHFQAGTSPTWVESDSDGLAALLAEHFGCKVGRPKGWKVEVPS